MGTPMEARPIDEPVESDDEPVQSDDEAVAADAQSRLGAGWK